MMYMVIQYSSWCVGLGILRYFYAQFVDCFIESSYFRKVSSIFWLLVKVDHLMLFSSR